MSYENNAGVQASVEKFPFCLECKEIIFTPICPDCLFNQFYHWVSDYSFKEKKKVLGLVRDYVDSFRNVDFFESCIICSCNRVYLCPYCFTEFVFNLMKSLGVEKKILGSFLFMFNFDFEHTGYFCEGEKLGVF